MNYLKHSLNSTLCPNIDSFVYSVPLVRSSHLLDSVNAIVHISIKMFSLIVDVSKNYFTVAKTKQKKNFTASGLRASSSRISSAISTASAAPQSSMWRIIGLGEKV